MCHHCRPATHYCPAEMSNNKQQQFYQGGSGANSRSSPKSRSRTPPHQQQQQPQRSLGYSPPAKQLAGGRMHEPPKPEDLPVPPMDWCGALVLAHAQAQAQEVEQQRLQQQHQQMQCDLASLALKRLLNVSA